jgi:hypothetical protein
MINLKKKNNNHTVASFFNKIFIHYFKLYLKNETNTKVKLKIKIKIKLKLNSRAKYFKLYMLVGR